MAIRRRARVIKRVVPRNCQFCRQKSDPDYKDADGLRVYISDRGKILGKDRTGICPSHQRALTREIKRARFLGLLPFVTGLR
ncbi:30S ribosomal protein S18 [Candidatus Shapirobacteria bacterium]|nr:30S ribosomal protein S18 [Candidatus Shapirobacteria bacterium]